MVSAYQVASYAATKHRFLGEMQQHKLLYYAQAWSLVWDGVALFDDPIEAWRDGPVVPTLRHVIAKPDQDSGLSYRQQSIVDRVIDYYGGFSGGELGSRAHSENPWRNARTGLSSAAHGTGAISHADMRREYTEQAIRGIGPRPPLGEATDAKRSEVLEVGKQAAIDWADTLEQLAQ